MVDKAAFWRLANNVLKKQTMFPLNQPEVLIANAIQKFDEKGILKDAATLERTNELLAALVDWTKKLE